MFRDADPWLVTPSLSVIETYGVNDPVPVYAFVTVTPDAGPVTVLVVPSPHVTV
jgi:hypothetical protein